MNKKKILLINLNEFNLNFLEHGAKKYKCNHIKKFLKLNNIKTFSTDKTQNKNLDPWVQNISINSGKRSSKHKIFNLGEKIPNKINQIWDILSANNCYCAVWGPMNTNFKNHKNIKIFLPDPWNHMDKVKPIELNNIYKLSRIYAKEYTDFKFLNNLSLFYKCFLYLLKSFVFFELIKYFPLYFKIIISNKGVKNFFLFFIFDIVSLVIFKNLSKKIKLNFSLIFLNSLAHFQHNNWDEKKNHKYYFFLTDQIFSIIFKIFERYDSLIIYNSFSQKLIKPSYLIRPKNPLNFFKLYKISFNKFHSNMTNGFIITYFDKVKLKKELEKIKKIYICGVPLFETKQLDKNNIFCRIQVLSKLDLSKKMNYTNITNNFILDNNKRFKRKTKSVNINQFISSVSFIKTTSKHVPEGSLYYKNLNLKKEKIENIKIFEIIKKFFKV